MNRTTQINFIMKYLSKILLCSFIALANVSCIQTKYNYSKISTETDNYLSEPREIAPFKNIEMNVVGEVLFSQSNAYSLVIEGDKNLVEHHDSKVENENLIVSISEDKVKENYHTGVRIHITAPDLQHLEFSGIGSFSCKKTINLKTLHIDYNGMGTLSIKDLNCKQLYADINGVGEADINVSCQNLIAEINGIGSLTLKGTTKHAQINKNGIGIVNTDHLTIKR